MVFDYLVSVKNERGKYINPLSQLLCLLSAIFFIAAQLKTGARNYILFAVSGLIIIGLIYNYYLAVNRDRPVSYARLLALSGFSWLFIPSMRWVVIPFLLLAVIEKHAKSPLEIGVTGDRVVFNSLIKRVFPWNALSNMMLKDGLLTIDFKNNRLFQKEVEGDTGEFLEAEFNDYCRAKLAEASAVVRDEHGRKNL